MLQSLQKSQIVVGLKQLRRGLNENKIAGVFLAENAEARVIDPVVAQCRELNIPIHWVPTMHELGKACAIDVGAAAVGILRDPEKS